jgi:hypothetical protein
MSAMGPAGQPGSWGADPKGSSASRHVRRDEDLRNLEAARGAKRDRQRSVSGSKGWRGLVARFRRSR